MEEEVGIIKKFQIGIKEGKDLEIFYKGEKLEDVKEVILIFGLKDGQELSDCQNNLIRKNGERDNRVFRRQQKRSGNK